MTFVFLNEPREGVGGSIGLSNIPKKSQYLFFDVFPSAERKRKALKSISLSQKIQLVCSSTAPRTIRSGERGAILFANQSTRHYILIKYKERRDKMDESTEKFQVGGGGVIFN